MCNTIDISQNAPNRYTNATLSHRGAKTRLNRQFRQAVASTDTHSAPPTAPASTPIPAFSSVTKVDCEEALVGLQLTSGCPVRQCADGKQLAEHVITLTRAIAEAPFKLAVLSTTHLLWTLTAHMHTHTDTRTHTHIHHTHTVSHTNTCTH